MKKLIILAVLMVVALTVWIPLWMISEGSMMGSDELRTNLSPVLEDKPGAAKWTALPLYPTLRHYIELLLDSPGFFTMFWNSVRIVVPVLMGQLIVAVPAAWGFARYEFKFKRILFTLYIALMLMPFQVTMVSDYFVLDKMSLLNTRWSVILPGIFSTFPVFIMYRFFRAIPESLIEAAEIDGAGPFLIFVRIGIPLGAPGVLSAMVLSFLEYWNMLEQPLAFLSDKALWPMSLYLPEIASGSAGVSLASSVVMLIPSVLIFLMGQQYLEKGIRAAGLKE